MNNYLLAAGVLAILLGLAHSVLGEIFVFRRLRVKNRLAWVGDNRALPVRAIRILWASWHIVTVFGLGFGAMLLKISLNVDETTT